MALRDDLKTAGISDELLSSVENVFRQHIVGEYVPKYRFDEINDKNKALAQELGRSESEKEALEKRAKQAEDGLAPLQEQLTKVEADWTKKYSDLEESHKKAEQERITLETYNARLAEVRKVLGDSAYDTDMVISLIDFNSLEIKDGKVTGADKAVEQIRKEKEFLFKDDSFQSTAPRSAPKSDPSKVMSFGEQLAKRASETDALTKAAADKYFK